VITQKAYFIKTYKCEFQGLVKNLYYRADVNQARYVIKREIVEEPSLNPLGKHVINRGGIYEVTRYADYQWRWPIMTEVIQVFGIDSYWLCCMKQVFGDSLLFNDYFKGNVARYSTNCCMYMSVKVKRAFPTGGCEDTQKEIDNWRNDFHVTDLTRKKFFNIKRVPKDEIKKYEPRLIQIKKQVDKIKNTIILRSIK